MAVKRDQSSNDSPRRIRSRRASAFSRLLPLPQLHNTINSKTLALSRCPNDSLASALIFQQLYKTLLKGATAIINQQTGAVWVISKNRCVALWLWVAKESRERCYFHISCLLDSTDVTRRLIRITRASERSTFPAPSARRNKKSSGLSPSPDAQSEFPRSTRGKKI